MQAIGNYVLVEVLGPKKEEKSEGGLVLPAGYGERIGAATTNGKILSVSISEDTPKKYTGLRAGQFVVFRRNDSYVIDEYKDKETGESQFLVAANMDDLIAFTDYKPIA